MTDDLGTRLLRDFEEADAARIAETYETFNGRPGPKVAEMIEMLARVWNRPVSSMLTDDISKALARYAAADPGHAEAVLAAAEAFVARTGRAPAADSALGQLSRGGLLEIGEDLAMLRALKGMFSASGSGPAEPGAGS